MRIAFSSRVQLLLGASALTILPRPEAAFADFWHAATITDKVRLEFIEHRVRSWGTDTPLRWSSVYHDQGCAATVETFKKAAASQLDVKCPASVDLSDEIMERSGCLGTKAVQLKGCLGNEFEPVSYAYSQIWSIEGGKRINAGAVRRKSLRCVSHRRRQHLNRPRSRTTRQGYCRCGAAVERLISTSQPPPTRATTAITRSLAEL